MEPGVSPGSCHHHCAWPGVHGVSHEKMDCFGCQFGSFTGVAAE